MQKIFQFLKTQVVLIAAWILAIISAFFVHPDAQYFKYIDWRSLGILWSLMAVMAAFRLNGVFEKIGAWLLGKVSKLWQLVAVLVFLCFFLSMFVTNDVALITFVPFAILILEACNCQKLLIPVIVLQTIAANLGSMLTPIGNPQNLYLFGLGGFSLGSFIKLMLPYSSLSLALLIICVACFAFNKTPVTQYESEQTEEVEESKIPLPVKYIVFSVLFILSILTVLHLVEFYILVPVVLICMLIFQRRAIVKADYSLLLTFIGFFIFTGNIARIDFINEKLQQLVAGREIIFGIGASQIISNVPASLLLSGFATSIPELTVGVNLGGLGTLIASMASLISFKFYVKTKNASGGRFLLFFTLANLVFLGLLILEFIIL